MLLGYSSQQQPHPEYYQSQSVCHGGSITRPRNPTTVQLKEHRRQPIMAGLAVELPRRLCLPVRGSLRQGRGYICGRCMESREERVYIQNAEVVQAARLVLRHPRLREYRSPQYRLPQARKSVTQQYLAATSSTPSSVNRRSKNGLLHPHPQLRPSRAFWAPVESGGTGNKRQVRGLATIASGREGMGRLCRW